MNSAFTRCYRSYMRGLETCSHRTPRDFVNSESLCTVHGLYMKQAARRVIFFEFVIIVDSVDGDDERCVYWTLRYACSTGYTCVKSSLVYSNEVSDSVDMASWPLGKAHVPRHAANSKESMQVAEPRSCYTNHTSDAFFRRTI